jgi:hypothetical protein
LTRRIRCIIQSKPRHRLTNSNKILVHLSVMG